MPHHADKLAIDARTATRVAACVLVIGLVLAVSLPLAIHARVNRVQATPLPAHGQAGLRSGLEHCQWQDGRLWLQGWAFVEGEARVAPIEVFALAADGQAVRLRARVERREDVASAHGRPATHDAWYDGVAAASSAMPWPPVHVVLLRRDAGGRLLGARHDCR